jgi:hypothetical protein
MIENKSQVMLDMEKLVHKERRVNPMARLKFDLLKELAYNETYVILSKNDPYFFGYNNALQFAISILNAGMSESKGK